MSRTKTKPIKATERPSATKNRRPARPVGGGFREGADGAGMWRTNGLKSRLFQMKSWESVEFAGNCSWKLNCRWFFCWSPAAETRITSVSFLFRRFSWIHVFRFQQILRPVQGSNGPAHPCGKLADCRRFRCPGKIEDAFALQNQWLGTSPICGTLFCL